MFEYKDEILSSRVGCLGASDANIIASVSTNGVVPKSARKRLAIAKGLVEPVDSFKNEAMRLGDEVEMAIYEKLKETDQRWQSNYKLTSKKFSKEHLSLIAHIDFFLVDEEKQLVKVVECKATKTSTMETHQTYKNQLYVEYALAKEYAAQLGKKWRVQIALCHYDTSRHEGVFDPELITIKNITFRTPLFDIDKGMMILDTFVAEMTEYYDGDEIDADVLPAVVKQQFDLMTNIVKEIKAQEQKVDEFKKKLYDFFVERGIKSVKGDDFVISVVEPSTATSFDYKHYLEDYERKYPRKYRKVIKEYSKTTNKKGYVTIKIKNN